MIANWKKILLTASVAFGAAGICFGAPSIPKMIGDFDLDADGNQLEFDVTPLVNGEGTYEISVQYTKGKNAIAIDSVSLLRDNAEVVRDEHKGSSGMLNNNNSYYLKYRDFKAGAHKIKVAANGMGGNDSFGKVVLKKMPLLELAGNWTAENMANGGEYDITKIMPKSGKIEVTFLYTNGPHAAGIRGVSVLADGKEVAKDVHKGITGVFHSNNVYKMTVPVKDGQKYTLKVDFDPNNDMGKPANSNGNIWLAELK